MRLGIFVTILVGGLSLLGCGSYVLSDFLIRKNSKVQAIKKFVDIQNKYMGKWYELYRMDSYFERGLISGTANYEFKGSYVKVTNKGYNPVTKKWNSVVGKAYIKNKNQSELTVSFFSFFEGDYWIVKLDPDYKWVVVSDPYKKYFWILSRTKEIDLKVLATIKEDAKSWGIDFDKVVKPVDQSQNE